MTYSGSHPWSPCALGAQGPKGPFSALSALEVTPPIGSSATRQQGLQQNARRAATRVFLPPLQGRVFAGCDAAASQKARGKVGQICSFLEVPWGWVAACGWLWRAYRLP